MRGAAPVEHSGMETTNAPGSGDSARLRVCTQCNESRYEENVNDGDRCMACQGIGVLASGGSMDQRPPYRVVEDGTNGIGQRFVRLRYADGSEDTIDPIGDDLRVGNASP